MLLINELERLESRLQEIPSEPGVYLMRDSLDSILYIGKSKKLRSRVRQYFRSSQPLSDRIKMMVDRVADIEFIVTDTETEALVLEANLIKQHQPHFNVLLKDDKRYPYVCITWSEAYPRIFITRQRLKGDRQDKYYGPYVDAGLLRQTLELIRRIFPLRQRRQPLFKDRPCLNYDLNRCPGVCQQLISPSDYRQTVEQVAAIFQGRTKELVEQLNQSMLDASAQLNFELAATIRDRITALKSLYRQQKVALADDTLSQDAVAAFSQGEHCSIQLFQIRGGQLIGCLGFFTQWKDSTQAASESIGTILQRVLEEHYSQADALEIPREILVQEKLPQGEMLEKFLSERKHSQVKLIVPERQSKAELIAMVERNAKYEWSKNQHRCDRHIQAMEDLAVLLDLPDLPKRMECYDISHFQGANAVGSRVVFIDGVPAKQHYRHYKIKHPAVTIGHADDFVSLAEVIARRFHQYDVNNLPSLIVIDGGKGQLAAVVNVLRQLDLLDNLKAIGLAKQKEEIFLPGESFPLITEPEQPAVQLLRRLRDEAHRFAVTFHRQQRQIQANRSRLQEIPGLGFEKQKQLLAHFHSLEYIRVASIEQLQQVDGIGKHLAKQIYDYFH